MSKESPKADKMRQIREEQAKRREELAKATPPPAPLPDELVDKKPEKVGKRQRVEK